MSARLCVQAAWWVRAAALSLGGEADYDRSADRSDAHELWFTIPAENLPEEEQENLPESLPGSQDNDRGKQEAYAIGFASSSDRGIGGLEAGLLSPYSRQEGGRGGAAAGRVPVRGDRGKDVPLGVVGGSIPAPVPKKRKALLPLGLGPEVRPCTFRVLVKTP